MCVPREKLSTQQPDPRRIKNENENLEDTLYYITRTFKELIETFEKNYWKISTATNQLIHFIAIGIITICCFIFQKHSNEPSILLSFCYVTCFSVHLGTQFWMTFMSGLSLYFTLPRHTFGSVQKILFPRYFFVNSILSFVTLLMFCKVFDGSAIQFAVLGVCFLLEFFISLYLTTPLVHLITEKNLLEAANGLGYEIGKFVPGNLVICPHYKKIYKRFRKLHATIAVGNMCAMACSVLHLYYLACKINGMK